MRAGRRLWSAIGATVLWASAGGGSAGTQTQNGAASYRLDIAAGALAEELDELAQQTHLQVLFSSQLVEGLRGPRIDGSMGVEEALRKLLTNTGLRFEFVNPHTITIIGSDPPHQERSRSGTATIRGTVFDARTGEPLANAMVAIRSQQQMTTSDAQGHFELSDVVDGDIEVYVSTVGYGLLRKLIELPSGKTVTLQLPLGPEAIKTGSDTLEEVTVMGKRFESLDADAVTQYTINSTEIQNLSTVFANDPFRAVQTLPGVSANDDFHAQFAVRGADMEHIGVIIDGVPTDNALHGFTDEGGLGSVSIINGAMVDSMSLLSGGFPASYSDRTGAILDVQTRDGDPDRFSKRIDVNLLGASSTLEGPLGSDNAGSWLVSARQSDLQYLVSQLNVSGLAVGFGDFDTKLNYQFNEDSKLSFTAILGYSQASRDPIDIAGQSAGFFTHADGDTGLSTVRWTWTMGPDTSSLAQLFWTHDEQTEHNPSDNTLLDLASRQLGLREVVTHALTSTQLLEAGLTVRQLQQSTFEQSIWDYGTQMLVPDLTRIADFSRSSVQSGAYLQDTLHVLSDRIKVTAAVRADRFAATGQSVALPHLDAKFELRPSTQLSAAVGQYAQFPSLDDLYGEFGTPNLRAERSTHEVLTLDQAFTAATRLHIEAYNRRDNDIIYSPLTQFRLLEDGVAAFPVNGPVLGNNYQDYSRGVEISLQRRSANGLSGWLSYSRGYDREWQRGGGSAFWGNNDQRNTFDAYGSFRLSPTLSFSVNARYGSGTPVAGGTYLAPSARARCRPRLLPSGLVKVRCCHINSLPRRTVRECPHTLGSMCA
jgi:outer membrane cobalamin receptor